MQHNLAYLGYTFVLVGHKQGCGLVRKGHRDAVLSYWYNKTVFIVQFQIITSKLNH